ncbi:hypoxanthine phosphoribosyltransferase [Gulosibacter molinativorax]|uniref:Hypoxanthine phosphoribosyltransferase n=1 Tax=Gulosibacter molinativorax TaxID=256821 RepID=A0ABT7C896_9MICO|nr:hypoxanthine phosphoribosyltransferase [Gulosibacter molinativorax]MDJ1370979.1 hypoxanthine phosphoribosyltransferase [Gulosibacter molinativorax]QUY62770.1 HptA protein [Gulosibacter molinativorax]
MRAQDCQDEIRQVLLSQEEIRERIAELAREIERDYAGKVPLLVGVLKGAVMVVSDLARELRMPLEMDWMAVSSYGSGTESTGVVRILKDLDTDLSGRDVLIVEDIIDSGLTLTWLTQNLASRGAASVEVCTLLRKPERLKTNLAVRYIGFDVPNEFVVGYGLDYDERYRNLRDVVVLHPAVFGADDVDPNGPVEPARKVLTPGLPDA